MGFFSLAKSRKKNESVTKISPGLGGQSGRMQKDVLSEPGRKFFAC